MDSDRKTTSKPIPRPPDKPLPIIPVKPITIIPRSCDSNCSLSSRPLSARFPSKPPPVPAGGIKDAPCTIFTIRQKSGNTNSKHKKRELGEFGKEKGKKTQQPNKQSKKKQVNEQSSKQDVENEEKYRTQSQRNEENSIDPKRTISEPLFRFRDYMVSETILGEEEVAFLSQKDKILSQRLTVLEQLDESRDKELTEREIDLVAFTEIIEEIEEVEESVMEEEKGGPIEELESILSSYDLEGGAFRRVTSLEEETAEKRKKSLALKRKIEDEFLLIDTLVQTYEDSNAREAEGDDLVLLEKFSEEFGEKKTEGKGEVEKEASKDGACSEEGKGVVEAIQGQMKRRRKMLTSEQAFLSQMERAIKVEDTRLSDLAAKKEQRIGYLEKLKVLKKKENEIREKLEKECKKLNEKSLFLMKEKYELMTRLSTMRRLITEKNKQITQLKLSKQSQQNKNEELKKKRQRENLNEKERSEGGKVEGMLFVQMAELCRVRNAWYKEVKEDLLSEIGHCNPKNLRSSSENPHTPLKICISKSSSHLKTSTGLREVRSIEDSPSSLSSSSPLPFLPTQEPPLPHSKKRSFTSTSQERPPSVFITTHDKETKGPRVNFINVNSLKEGLDVDSERGNFLEKGAEIKGKEHIELELSKTPTPLRAAPELPQHALFTPQEKEKGAKKKPRKRMCSRNISASSFQEGSPFSSPADPRSNNKEITIISSVTNLKKKFNIGSLYKSK